MSVQLSVSERNARLDQFESTAGTAAILKIRTGSAPSDCSQADSGTALSTITLPSDWMANASAGSKAKQGTWSDTNAANSGTAGHFRLYDSTATTCHMQGTVTASGGGGDLTLNTTTITAGQTVTINGFTLTDANA